MQAVAKGPAFTIAAKPEGAGKDTENAPGYVHVAIAALFEVCLRAGIAAACNEFAQVRCIR